MANRLATVLVGIVLSVTVARADPRLDRAKQQVAVADIDYRLARFGDALAGYTRAYELYPVPALLFNIGQCHRNLKDYAKAVFFFEGYLRDLPAATNRALVEDLIREAQAELDKAKSQPPAGSEQAPVASPTPAGSPPPAAPSPAPAAPPAVAPTSSVEPGRGDASAQGDRPPHRSLLVPGVLLGSGIAALAGGATFYYYGQHRGPDVKYVYDDTRALGGTMMVLGAGSVVAGAILVLRRPSGGAPVVAIGARGAYLGWAGAY